VTFRLYDFQEQALEAEARHRAEHPDETRLAIVLPTGTGKSMVLAERARRFVESFDGAGNRVLIIAHTDELVDQLETTVRYVAGQSEFPITVGVVKADRNETDADIVIGCRQTLEIPGRRARISNVGLVVVDECHIGHTAYMPIMQHFGCMGGLNWTCARCGTDLIGNPVMCPSCMHTVYHPRYRESIPALGFTATLERSDGAGLGAVWQDVAFTRDISWAVRKGYLVQPIGYRLEIDLSDGKARFENTDRALDTQLCEGLAPERVVEKWQEIKKERGAEFMPTILFAPLVRSARLFADTFAAEALTITVGVVHGDMPKAERRQVIADFKAGRIEVLCNAMVLTAGFDHPDIECVVIARPTKSRTLAVQMAGRGLRRKPGVPVEEQSCALVFLADATTDLCSIADLSDRPIDRKAQGPLTEMEDAWDIGADLEEAARHWTGKVDATKFDPIVATRSKVWTRTKAGHWFLPLSKDREYVFLLGDPDGNTDIYVLTRDGSHAAGRRVGQVADSELAFSLAEDEAAERGGDVGALLADRTRAWRKQKPGQKMLDYAERLGLAGEVQRIMSATAGGKAGKVSDLIRRVEASRTIDKMVEKIKGKVEA
jgi:superfamily II DNA or RNA helicase